MKQTTDIKASPCPYCGYITDAASGDGIPKKDCISICIQCAGLSQFNEDMSLRKIDEHVYREVIENDDVRDKIKKYQNAVLLLQKFKSDL